VFVPSQSVLEFPPLFRERIKYAVHGDVFGVGSEQMFVDGGCDKRMTGLVALIHLALNSVVILPGPLFKYLPSGVFSSGPDTTANECSHFIMSFA